MGFFDIFKKKEVKEETWVTIDPMKVKKKVDTEKPMIIRDDKNKIKRMSKAELKKYFPNLEFD